MELKGALEYFYEAASLLLSVWEQSGKELCDGYPFPMDFQEIPLLILNWIEANEADFSRPAGSSRTRTPRSQTEMPRPGLLHEDLMAIPDDDSRCAGRFGAYTGKGYYSRVRAYTFSQYEAAAGCDKGYGIVIGVDRGRLLVFVGYP